jgi:hypothetical protein
MLVRPTVPLARPGMLALAHSLRSTIPSANIAVNFAAPMAAASCAAFAPPPRPFVIWFAILMVATAAKNIAKMNSKPKIQRQLADSGECPFPFIFFHDPMTGLQKHSGKLMLCALLWAFKRAATAGFARP